MEELHMFQGMRRDSHPIKQDKNLLWEAHNIRLTSREGDSMLSITNERSTKPLMSFKGESYVGHVVLGDYLVLFTKGDKDTIYRINIKSQTKVILYRGDLNISTDKPIQAIGDFESEFIQKVYWVDGSNHPRVINIVRPELLKKPEKDDYSDVYTDAPFDFVQELNLNEDIEVKRLPNGSGIFSPGTIQYALTYYHKYGQESNIFYTSELLYISHNNRGGNPNDNISTAFEINIKSGLQKNFGFVRIYSISRTSIDATPVVKRVTDIEIKNDSISFVDDGTSGDIVDPTKLLYIGGKSIIAGCIASKDNTLFLGNIKYEREEVSNTDAIRNHEISTDVRTIEVTSNDDTSNDLSYYNQLSTNTSTFKSGETYRLGVQFQYNTGEWSEPLYIKNIVMDKKPSVNGKTLSLPVFNSTSNFTGLDKRYIRVRPLIAIPSTKDKTILAQGILCPTVFNADYRQNNSPFAQASWFLRPFSTFNPEDEYIANEGSIAEFRHYTPLVTGLKRASEIQNMFLDTESTRDDTGIDMNDLSLNKVKEALDSSDNNKFRSIWYVDQSILTFHSPDIEFNDKVSMAVNNNSEISIRLVGAVPFTSNYGDIDIQTSSPVINPDASGFVHKVVTNSSNGAKSLISGLFYEDSITDDIEPDGKLSLYSYSDPIPWLVYPWHRSGSLNNDIVRPDGSTRTSVLKKKVISNIKFSKDNKWLTTPYPIATSEIQIFNSNEISLLKIKDNKNNSGDITYYGNVDTLNTSYSKYRLVRSEGVENEILGTQVYFSFVIHQETELGSESISINRVPVKPESGNPKLGTMTGTVTGGSRYIEIPTGVDSSVDPPVVIKETVDINGSTFNITISESGRYNSPFDGSITIKGNSYRISGNTTYKPTYVKGSESHVFKFDGALRTIDSSSKVIGDFQEALKLPKDAVRIKYKSTPHAMFATNYNNGIRKPLPVINGTKINSVDASGIYWQDNVPAGDISPDVIDPSRLNLTGCPSAYLWLAEIVQNVSEDKRYGGKTEEALRNNLWIPAGPSVKIGEKSLIWEWGDTWYQRYDCLKTYPFTNEDENQVVEIGSFMCESRINIDGRYDRNRGAVSNLNMSPINFNLINQVYSQLNNFFNYRILDHDYYISNSYPSQVLWTGVKSPSAIQDEWTNLHMASSLDLDGANGKLTAIQPFNDVLLGFQDRSVQHILFNSRVQIQASDGVPIEIANSQKVEGSRALSTTIGCQDKFSILETPMGVYFIDNEKSSLYLYNGQLQDISLKLGHLYWLRDNHSNTTWKFKLNEEGNNGIRLFYDNKFEDVYLVPGNDLNTTREALCYSEQLQQFTSLMSYGGSVMFSHDSKFYSIAENENGILTLYQNFTGIDYNNIFGIPRPFSLSFISNDNPITTKIFNTIDLRADRYEPNSISIIGDEYTVKVQEGQPFDYIQATNEYQNTDIIPFNSSTLRKKFRIWRAIIPRAKKDGKYTGERIRNPWSKITLGCNEGNKDLTILHDLSVHYTV